MIQRLSVCSRPSTTVLMPPLNEPNDFTAPETNQRSFLVTLSARALGSVGFGLSILAIWVRWLVPSAKATGPAVTSITQTPRRSRRQLSLPAPSAHNTRRITSPIILNGDDINQNNGNQDHLNRSRRVYFADTPTSLRNLSPPEHPIGAVNENTPVLRMPVEETVKLSFSSSSFAAPPLIDTFSRRDNYDESVAESDSSSRRSSLSSHLPRIIHPFGGKFPHNGQSEPSPASRTRTPPSLRLADDPKSVRRSSLGLTPPWLLRNRNRVDTQGDTPAVKSSLPFRRPSTPKDTSGLRSSSTDSVQSPSTSYFSLKSHRRTSNPVPRARTQPYEAPYFATPPISPDFTAFDTRKSRQILHDALTNSARGQATIRQEVSNDDGNRGRQTDTREQTVLDRGHPRTLPKRRSASESWINGRRAQL